MNRIMEEKEVSKVNKKSNGFYTLLASVFNLIVVSKKEYEDLKYFKNTSVGLYAIDQNPKTVTYEWIIKNNFRIKEPDYK
ncbi:hypothetical protein [Flaviramulus aquimarinus]